MYPRQDSMPDVDAGNHIKIFSAGFQAGGASSGRPTIYGRVQSLWSGIDALCATQMNIREDGSDAFGHILDLGWGLADA